MIVSAAGRFAGIRFREMSVSAEVVSSADSAESPSYFLERAFNSNQFFAFCERVFFSTPYDCANVGVVDSIPAEISVSRRGRVLLQVSMDRANSPTTRRPTLEREDAWTAQILLPKNARSAVRRNRMFFARIRGATCVYPFLAGKDRMSLQKQADGDIFHALQESGFAPAEWIVRSSATHAKSKTYDREELTEFELDTVGQPSHALEPAAGPVLNGESSPPAQ